MRQSPGTRDRWNAIIADPPVDAPVGRRLVVKDNIDAAGFPTRCGSPAIVPRVPETSAPVVALLEEAGFVVIGKANLHELSFGVTSTNPWLGPVRNPYSPDRIPGGSSGGTAAAIAAGLADAGIGGDTGGSLRIPASLCGIVGFRASRARYPHGGAIGLSPTRDVLGPMARTVADLEGLDRILCGRRDAIRPLPLAGLRIGVPRRPFFQTIDHPTEAAVASALAAMERAGCELVDIDLGELDALQPLLDYPTAGFEIANTFRGLAAAQGQTLAEFAENITDPGVRAAILGFSNGEGPSEADYRKAIEIRPALTAIYRRAFAETRVVAMVFPCAIAVAPRIGEDRIEIDGAEVTVFDAMTRNCWPASVADLPGLCMPVPAAGLPVGLEIDGADGDDDRVIALGLALEALFASAKKQ